MRDINKYEIDYLNNYGFEKNMVKYRRKQVLECLANYPHDNILEIGCGLEPLFEHIDFKEYYVVEPSKAFSDNALQKSKKYNNVHIYPTFLDNTIELLYGHNFDFIILSSLIHEVDDPNQLILSVKKLSSKDTIIHINVPNSQSLHNLLGIKMGLNSDISSLSKLAQKMQRTSTFNLHKLIKFIHNSGFTTIEQGGYFLKPFTHEQMEKLLMYVVVVDNKILDGLYELGKDYPEQSAEIYVNARIR